MADLIVRDKATRSEVHRVTLANPTQRSLEKCLSGLLRNMSDSYYVDDSEFDYLYQRSDATR